MTEEDFRAESPLCWLLDFYSFLYGGPVLGSPFCAGETAIKKIAPVFSFEGYDINKDDMSNLSSIFSSVSF